MTNLLDEQKAADAILHNDKAEAAVKDALIENAESGNDHDPDVDADDALVKEAIAGADSAIVLGEVMAMAEFPEDLYIPPQALRVFLEAFTGPLDLLLYLIRKQNIDILDIPVAKITAQYVEYLEVMSELRLELAAEYLVMAAILAEIKSKLLLPCFGSEEQEEDDPRAELVRRLQEYDRYKRSAEELDTLPRLDRDVFPIVAEVPEYKIERPLPKLELQDLVQALKEVLQRAAMYSSHKIKLENISVRARMAAILDKLHGETRIKFSDFFQVKEGKLGVVVTFMAILELLRQKIIAITQSEPFSNIYIQNIDVSNERGE